jgi:hypothetical protein
MFMGDIVRSLRGSPTGPNAAVVSDPEGDEESESVCPHPAVV